MDRITEKQMIYQLTRLAAFTGKRVGDAWVREADGTLKSIIGTIFIETNDPGDGWTRYRVCEITNELGGEGHPFGNSARRRGEMYQTLYFAVSCFEEAERNKQKAEAA